MMMMITYIIAAVILCVGYLIYIELSNYFHLKFYEKQGVKTIYYPIMGGLALIVKGAKLKDQDSSHKEIYKKYQKEDFIVINASARKGGIVYIKSPEAISDIMRSEKFVQKMKHLDNDFFGFFVKNGAEAMNQKAIFAKIFHKDNLESLCRELSEVVDEHLKHLVVKNKISNENWTKLDLKEDLYKAVFEDFTQKILFGNKELKEIPKLENGESIVTGISKAMDLAFEIIKSKGRIMTFGLAEKYSLIKPKRDFDNIRRQAKEIVIKLYKERLAEGRKSPKRTLNFMDSLIEHNNNCTRNEEKMGLNDIYSNFELFQFAASDTSYQVTTSTLVILAKKINKKTYERLSKDIQEKMPSNPSYMTREILDSSDTLEKTIKESMRLNSPIVRNAGRICTRDIKVCGKIIKKGEIISICQSALNNDDRIHKNPEIFDIERFSPENEKKLPRNSYIPFSVGQRNCIGQYLGKMMAKITISRFLKVFDVEELEDFEHRSVGVTVVGYEKAMIKIRMRS